MALHEQGGERRDSPHDPSLLSLSPGRVSVT